MNTEQIVQGTPEWFEARRGKPSASRFGDLITYTGKPSSSAAKYIQKLTSEIITGEIEPSFQNEHMRRGIELEPVAREAYSIITDQVVGEFGFMQDDEENYGCSPDGIIFGDVEFEGEEMLIDFSGLEIKCPALTTMTGYLLDNHSLVKAYYQQLQGSLLVTGAKWWDIFAYHPKTAPVLVRVYPDEDYMRLMEFEIDKAVNQIKLNVEKLV